MITALTLSFHKLQKSGQFPSLSVYKLKITCNCKKKGSSDNNSSVLMQQQLCSEINKFSQSTIIFYYNQIKYASFQEDFFTKLQENAFLGDLSLSFPQTPLNVWAFGPQFYSVRGYSQGNALLLFKGK